MRIYSQPIVVILAAATLSACSTTTSLRTPPAGYANARADSNCKVDIYADKSQKPQRPYRVITQAESSIRQNVFFGGKATLDNEAFAELRKQACKVGADAVVISDYIESSATEMSHIYVWADLVRYEDRTDN